MKVTYDFDDDIEGPDYNRRRIFEKAEDFYSTLYDIDQECRRIVRSVENPSEDAIRLAEDIRDMIVSSGYHDLE